MTRGRDGGVILVNVLVLLAVAATVVYLLLSVGALAVARSQRFGEAGRALALIQAGEQSAIVALRRDMRDAPGIDHAGEDWGEVAQEPIEIDGGSFAVAISDAQDRFNLNAVGGETPEEPRKTLQKIVTALGLPDGTAATVADAVVRDGPLRQVSDLTARAGIPPRDVARLSGLVTALPGEAPVNVNAAPPELLAVLFGEEKADTLVSLRKRNGFLAPEMLTAEGITLPPGVGFASDLYRLQTTVRMGDTRQSMESLLQRREPVEGRPEVAVVMRRNALAVPAAPAEPAR